MKPKLIRLTTVPISMNIILRGQLRYVSTHFDVIGVSSYDAKHFNDIEKREGVTMYPIEMPRDISLINDLKALWKLYWYFRRERPYIVHTHTPKAGLLGMIASKLAKVPVRLHTVGGIPQVELKGFKRRVLNFTEKLTYRLADKVYPNSEGLRNIILTNKYCDSSKLNIIANGSSNGVDARYFDPNYLGQSSVERSKLRKKLSISEEEIVFLFVGRIAKDKGINELVTAFNSITGFSISLLLVGPYEKEYGVLDKSIKMSLENNPRIKLLGRFDDVRPYYLLSDIFVFPSYREGFPNAVLEAQAMQLPCIVSDINGCNEIVEDQVNGLIVPPKDALGLSKAMQRMLKDQEFRTNLGVEARKIILEKFERSIVQRELLKEYCSFIKSSKDNN